MLCVILLSLSLVEQICFYSCESQEMSQLTFFVCKQQHFPTAVCSAVLVRVTFHLEGHVPKVHSSSVNSKYPEKCCREFFFSPIPNRRGKTIREAKACYLSFLHEVLLKRLPYLFVCICSRCNSFGSLMMVQITPSVILNYV